MDYSSENRNVQCIASCHHSIMMPWMIITFHHGSSWTVRMLITHSLVRAPFPLRDRHKHTHTYTQRDQDICVQHRKGSPINTEMHSCPGAVWGCAVKLGRGVLPSRELLQAAWSSGDASCFL